MEKVQDYKFIDGVFTIDDADKLLIALLNYKIDYHNREDFSNHIRFNHEIAHSKVRIQELLATKDEVKHLIDSAKEKNKKLVINSTLTIRLEE
ncbi:hypothetical protein [Flavobacterium sp.]|uniref:hypothetical protein n=1 Tax=Flavobacterium sp. TaxID=239 RepID=UPI003342E22E